MYLCSDNTPVLHAQIFTVHTIYIDLNNINRIFPDSVTNLQPLFSFLNKIEDRESFSVYKLKVDFGTFQLIYDDDSLLSITGQFSNKKEFEAINSIYMQICSNIRIEGWTTIQWQSSFFNETRDMIYKNEETDKVNLFESQIINIVFLYPGGFYHISDWLDRKWDSNNGQVWLLL